MEYAEKFGEEIKKRATEKAFQALGVNDITGDVTIDSVKALKEELKLGNLDTTNIDGLIKSPITFTRKELLKLQSEIVGTDPDKLNKLKKIIEAKVGVTAEASSKTKDLQKNLSLTAAGLTTAAVSGGFAKKISEMNDAEGFDKVSKISELFDWGKNLYKAFTTFISVKAPWLAKIFGWEGEAVAAEIPGMTQKAVETAKTAAEEVKGATKAALPEKASDMMSDEKYNKAFDQLKTDLTSKYNIKWDADRTSNFETLKSRYEKRFKERFKNKDLGNSNILDLAVLTGTDPLLFSLDLVSFGILPLSSIGAEIVNEGMGVIKISLKLASGELYQVLGDVSFSEMKTKLNELSPDQKSLLLGLIYRKGGIAMALLGQASALAMNSFVVPATWHERTGIAGATMKTGAAFGEYEIVRKGIQNFDFMTKGLDEMLVKLGGTGELVTMTRKRLIESSTKVLMVEMYQKHGKDPSVFKNEIEKLMRSDLELDKKFVGHVHSKLSGEALTSKAKLGNKLGDLIKETHNSLNKTEGFERVFGNVKQYVKGPYASPEYAAEIYGRNLRTLDEGLCAYCQSGNKVIEAYNNVRNSLRIGRIPLQTNAVVPAITKGEADSFIRNLKILAIEAPDLAKGFFHHLPIISVIGLSAAEEGNFFENFARGMKFMIPLVGPFLLCRDGLQMKDWTLPKVGQVALGGSLVAVDIYGACKAYSAAEAGFLNRTMALGRFAARPIDDIASLAGGTLRTVSNTRGVFANIAEAVKAGETGELLSMLGKGLIGTALFSIIVYSGYKEWKNNSPEQLEANLKKEGLIDAEGNLVFEKLKEKFPKLDQDKRNLIIKLIATHFKSLDNPGNQQAVVKAYEDITVTPDGNGYKIIFNELASTVSVESIENTMKDLGVKDIKISYTSNALKSYARSMKKDQGTKEEFVKMAKNMNIRLQDAESIFNKV